MNILALIIVIGLLTYGTRLFFLITDWKIFNRKDVYKALQSVPITMLVALVIPYTFFRDNTFQLINPATLALILTAIIMYFWKRSSYTIIVAFLIYSLLLFGSQQ